MNRFQFYILTLLASLIMTFGIFADLRAQTTTTPPISGLACAYNSTAPSITTGQFALVQCDSSGSLLAVRASRPIVVTQASFEASPGGVNGIARYQIPAGKVYRPRALYGLFTTDATVANRRISTYIWDSSNGVVWQGIFIFTQTASLSNQSYAGHPFAPTANSTNVIITMPDLALGAGYKIGFANITGFTGGAADAWTNLALVAEDETP